MASRRMAGTSDNPAALAALQRLSPAISSYFTVLCVDTGPPVPPTEAAAIGLMTIGWMSPFRLIDPASFAIPCSEIDRRGWFGFGATQSSDTLIVLCLAGACLTEAAFGSPIAVSGSRSASLEVLGSERSELIPLPRRFVVSGIVFLQ